MEQKVHVLLHKDELNPAQLGGKVVVVLDVLFATTTIAAALAAGCSDVLPVVDGASARAAVRKHHESGSPSPLVAGEWMAETIADFSGATPLEVLALPLKDRRLILATTNGTVALVRSQQASEVLVGSLVNASAVVEHLVRFHRNRTVLLVCSGSTGRINLEDVYGAGHMVSLLRAMPGERIYTDAALAAEMVYLQGRQRPLGTGHPLWQSSVGQYMARKGHAEDVAYAARENVIDIVPMLQADGRVVAA